MPAFCVITKEMSGYLNPWLVDHTAHLSTLQFILLHGSLHKALLQRDSPTANIVDMPNIKPKEPGERSMSCLIE